MNIKPKGFTIFFAVLVASLSLSVGLVIYDLLVREISLAQVATQSQYAIYASDTAAECALYWDLKFRDISPTDYDGSAFATSSYLAGGIATAGQATCNGQDITAASSITNFKNSYSNNNAGWDTGTPTASTATTTFWISMGSTATAPCAKVEVGKKGNPSLTYIVSHGYNTCSTAGLVRLERILQVSY